MSDQLLSTSSYRTRDPLVAFLYELLRDTVPVGVVYSIVQDQDDKSGTWVLTNGKLAELAEEFIEALRKQDKRGDE